MTFGRVEVVFVEQLRQKAMSAEVGEEETEEILKFVGFKGSENQEIPAIIVIEKIKGYLEGRKEGKVKEEKETGQNENKAKYDKEGENEAKHDSQSVNKAKHDEESEDKAEHDEQIKDINKQNNENESNSSQKLDDNQVNAASFVNNNQSNINQSSQIEPIEISFISITPKGYSGSFIYKHLDYLIKDLRNDSGGSGVVRRFRDFVTLKEYLVEKFPFRIVPVLPVKKVQIFTNQEFLDHRLEGLRRFTAIVASHRHYCSDPLVKAFLCDQNEFVKLSSNPRFMTNDRDQILVSQIPTADLLVEASLPENTSLVQKSRKEVVTMILFYHQVIDHLETLLDAQNTESKALAKLVTTLSSNGDITNSFCFKCAKCQSDHHKRSHVGRNLCAFIESNQETILLEREEVVDNLKLLLDLLESYNELLVRMNDGRFGDFEELSREIISLQGEIEKKQLQANSEDIIRRLALRLELLQREYENHQTFNKFILFCVWDELNWLHAHKEFFNSRLNQLIQLVGLKNQRWIDMFKS